jgi:hypothetical protein
MRVEAPYLTALMEGLNQGLKESLGNDRLVDILDRRSPQELVQAGRRAVQLAVAPLLSDHKLGPMLDTSEVVTGWA